MKGLIRKTISLVIAMLMVVGLISAAGMKVNAEDKYFLYVGGVEVTPDCLAGEGWKYEPEKNELSLSGFNYDGVGYNESGILYTGTNELNIVINGVLNSINMTPSGKDCDCYGIFSNADITFSGDGTMYIIMPDSTDNCLIGENMGVLCKGNITAVGGKLICFSGSATLDSYGIYTEGKIISKGGLIEGKSFEAPLSCGIVSENGIEVSEGEVCGDSFLLNGFSGDTTGITCFGNLTVDGGKVTGNGGSLKNSENASSCGIEVSGDITVNGGSLNAEAGKISANGQESVGVVSEGNVVVGADAVCFEARGYTQAVVVQDGTFTNAKDGYGWMDYSGEGDGVYIPVDSSYESISSYKKVRISDPLVEVEAEGFVGTYDKKGHSIKVTVKEPESGYTIKYGNGKGKYDMDEAPVFVDAGVNNTYYLVTADGYIAAEGYATVRINKADQIIEGENLNLKVGQSAKIKVKSTGDGELSYRLKIGKAISLDTKTGEVKALKEGTGAVIVTASATDNYKMGTRIVLVKVTSDAPPAPVVKTINMLRLYNPNSGEHFYTASTVEKEILVKVGWKYEGLAWKAPVKSQTPVYRLYNKNAGDHHYTISSKEKDDLIKAGWKYEGIGWYSDDAKTVPLYRLYNPNAIAGSHHYTISKTERDNLIKAGWKDEGIAWFGR